MTWKAPTKATPETPLAALAVEIGLWLLLALQTLAVLYAVTSFPFPYLEFVYEGF